MWLEDPNANSLTQLSSPELPTFTCECKRILKGKPCSSQFSPLYFLKMRDNCAELLKNNLDNIIKGQIMAFTSLDVVLAAIHQRSLKKFEGHINIKATFAHLHGIGKTLNMAINIFSYHQMYTGKDRLNNIRQH